MFNNDKSTWQRRPPPEIGNADCDSFNLGSEEDPHMLNIGKVYTEKERKEMLQLLTKYKDVIPWIYEDLKTYDLDIIVHDLPLKPDVKPFCQRQRPVNPLIEPLIMKIENLLEAK